MNNVFDFFLYIYSNDGLPYVLYIRYTKTHKHNTSIPIHGCNLYHSVKQTLYIQTKYRYHIIGTIIYSRCKYNINNNKQSTFS